MEPHQTCLDAFREILRTPTRQILHNWQLMLESDDPEGPHQLRVGIRRLRAVFRLIRPIADGPGLRRLDSRIRDFGRQVGELRDADVLATETVGRLARRHAEVRGIGVLQSLLSDDREEHRRTVRQSLASTRNEKLKLELAKLPDNLEQLLEKPGSRQLMRPIGQVGESLLKKRWNRIVKLGKRFDDLGIEERHALRKELKVLRYSIESLAPLYPKRKARRLLKNVSRMQDLLGYANDVAVAEQLLQARAVAESADQSVAHAVGYVIGWHTARAEQAWKEARAAWDQLKGSPHPWS